LEKGLRIMSLRHFRTSVALVALAGCGDATSGLVTAPTTTTAPTTSSSSQTSCPAGATALQPRALTQGHFSALHLTDGAVLATGTELQRLSLAGDPPVTLTQASEMRGLVVVGQSVYFTAGHPVGAPNAQGKQSSTSALYSAPMAGGAPTLVLDVPLEVDGAATDGVAIYFAGYGPGVTRVAVADGAESTLALPRSLGVNAVAVHDGFVYVAAFDGSGSNPSNGVIVKMPTTGSAPQTIVTNIGHPWSLVADASGLFWVEDPPEGTFGDGHIARAGLDGSGVRTVLPHSARSLTVDGGYLFFAWDTIGKIPVGGGPVTTLVPGLNAPGLLTVAKGNAVWVDPVTQALSDPTVPSLMTTCW
jgi:hypothetical protein